MFCKCGLPIDKVQATEDMYVCSCGCCWEIIEGIMHYSGSRQIATDIATGATFDYGKLKEIEKNPTCLVCEARRDYGRNS